MIKQIIFSVIFLLASILWLNAQSLLEMQVEATTEEAGSVFTNSCSSPDQGVLVFKTAITGLSFELNMPDKLFNVRHNIQRNEYVLCVEPTARLYWITISGAGYEATDIAVRSIEANRPLFFRINPKLSATAQQLMVLGDNSFNNNQFAEAEAHYRRALSEFPNEELLHKLAETCLKQNKRAEAVEFLQRAAIINPRNEKTHQMLGRTYLEMRQFTNAAISLKNAIDLAPSNPEYREEMQRAIEGAPNRAQVNAEVGKAYFADGNYVEAIRYFTETVNLEPNNVEYRTLANNAARRSIVEPEMVFVQGGVFLMGNNNIAEEQPQHRVTVSSFNIGKYPVTQGQWQALMGSNPSNFKRGDNYPVENVSWNDAQEFIRRLNAATGKRYRLPTEAEWEYAARGGIKNQGYMYSGSNNVNEVAWYSSNSRGSTQSVGSKVPNELGIFDMSGNVREWCNDRFGKYSSGQKRNPTGRRTGSTRVHRGGSWIGSPQECRVAQRGHSLPNESRYNIGFRLVLQ